MDKNRRLIIQSRTMNVTLVVLLWMSFLSSSSTEEKAIHRVRDFMERSGGRVVFSELYNSSDLEADEKAFLGRLYELFFAIPEFLLNHHRESSKPPTRQIMAARFQVSLETVDLLLAIMTRDPRLPTMVQLDPESGEITAIEAETIGGFLRRRGGAVKVRGWRGKPLPAFELSSFAGSTVRSTDLRGKSTLIYFWFTGCPPCVRIAPILGDLDRRYGASNFQVVGLNADRVLGLDVSDRERKAHLNRLGVDFANLHIDQATRQAFGNVKVFPTLFFTDSKGQIVRHLINFQSRVVLEEIVQGLVSKNR